MVTRVLTAHVPLALAKKVDRLAARLERSRAWIVEQALAAWIECEEKRHQLMLEALADVDAGRVVDHRLVKRAAASLAAKARAKAWKKENRKAIETSNEYVTKHGLPLAAIASVKRPKQRRAQASIGAKLSSKRGRGSPGQAHGCPV
jgi:predicted transcriptional regulator